MNFSVRIRQHEARIEVETGETILSAALRQGVSYPHGCQSGNCGACKSRLYSGNVEMSPYSEFALTEEERTRGLILACRSVPWEDSDVGWLDADETIVHPRRTMQCRVARIEDATHDIRRIWLCIEQGGPYIFSAGQYARVTFEGMPGRDYSMANRPDEPALEFHVRHVAGGTTSSYVGERLRVGDPVTVEGPFGMSYLRELHGGPVLALAGGSGLAPILSICRTAAAKAMRQPIHILFGVRDERDMYMEQQLRELCEVNRNFDLQCVLSEPASPTPRATGFLHDRVADRFADFDGWKAYLAGPPPMVESAQKLLESRGMLSRDIHADAFYTEAEKAALEGPIP